MQVIDYHPTNVVPVTGEYTLDKDVSLKHVREHTSVGMEFNFINALSAIQDTSSNNSNSIYLTEPKYIHNILDVETNKTIYPTYKRTCLKAGSYYWCRNSSDVVILSAAEANDLNNNHFFELEIVDENYLAVRQYDGTSLKYLTLSPSTSAVLKLEARSVNENNVDRDTQLFNYILTDSALTLTTRIWHSTTSSLINPSVVVNKNNYLSAAPVDPHLTDGLNSDSTQGNAFTITSSTVAPGALNLRNTWQSYLSAGGDSLSNIDISQSHENVQNNFLTTTSTNEISSTMSINFFPLKNQLTVDGNQKRGNPYGDTENETTHRLYHGLHTGPHQEHGDAYISLNYASGVKDLTLKSNAVTYFHVPSVIEPYEALNINDSSLINCGAIAGDVPSRSDKVYKHRTDNNNLDNITDAIDNTWLCTWLSGNNDPGTTSIWVDRYINPRFITEGQSLSSTAYIATYDNKFSSVVKKLSSQNIHQFDTLSELTFQPNALYAYHHIGNRDSEKMVNNLTSNILVDDNMLEYKSSLGTTIEPEYITDKPTHTMSDGTLMTGHIHSDSSLYVPKTYTFDGHKYASSSDINHDGSFSLNFWIYSDDWSSPIGDQIIGNYTTHGFGIFNEPFVTPLIIIPDGNKVQIYNSQYNHIDTHSVDKTIEHFTRRGSTGNYWFVDDNNDIYEYNVAGIVQNKISSSHLTGRTIRDIEVDEDYVYAITAVEGNSARYFKYDLKNQASDYIGESRSANIWNYSNLSSSYNLRIHSTKKGLSGSSSNIEAPIIIVGPDDSLSQGSTVDNYGNPWVIQDNYLYTYDTSVSSNIVGISAAGTDTMEGVNCDRDNNIWLLYGNTKVAKFNTDRKLALTTNLSATPYQSTRYIDFIHEFTPSGYGNSVTILNQSMSGCKGFIVDNDTCEIQTSVSILTGDNPVTHFATPLSSYSLKTTSGFDYIRKHQPTSRPRLDAKISLTNLYNSSTTTAAYSGYTLSVDLSTFDPGWRNICVNMDTENGNYTMFVDSTLVDSIDLPSGKFAFSNMFTRPLAIGASPFQGISTPIGDYLKQDGYYYATGIKINRLKLYDKSLTWSDIKCHYNIGSEINDIIWPVPTGQRSYVDTVERVFKHRLPGRASEIYNIQITGLDITDPALRGDIEDRIRAELDAIAPAYTRFNKIQWGNDAATGNVNVSDIPVIINVPNTDTTGTTPVDTGDTQSYGY